MNRPHSARKPAARSESTRMIPRTEPSREGGPLGFSGGVWTRFIWLKYTVRTIPIFARVGFPLRSLRPLRLKHSMMRTRQTLDSTRRTMQNPANYFQTGGNSMRKGIHLLVTVWCAMFLGRALAADPGSITIDATQPGAKIGPMFYGLMTEEINHAYDGGLYAELIQNRTFQDRRDRPIAWSVVPSESAGKIALDTNNPVNEVALKTS